MLGERSSFGFILALPTDRALDGRNIARYLTSQTASAQLVGFGANPIPEPGEFRLLSCAHRVGERPGSNDLPRGCRFTSVYGR